MLQIYHFTLKHTLCIQISIFRALNINSTTLQIFKIFHPLNMRWKDSSHRFLIEPLSQHSHLKTILMSRYIKFHKSLINNRKFTVRFLARLFEKDQRTVLGSTLNYLTKQCHLKSSELDKLSSQSLKGSMKFQTIPPDRKWVCSLATELLSTRSLLLDMPGFTQDEIETLLQFACTCTYWLWPQILLNIKIFRPLYSGTSL